MVKCIANMSCSLVKNRERSSVLGSIAKKTKLESMADVTHYPCPMKLANLRGKFVEGIKVALTYSWKERCY